MDANDGVSASRRSAPPARRAVISPLLANIYLDPLDMLLAERGYRMVRYADDFVILCRDRAEADGALAMVADWVRENGLVLHPTKTQIANCRKKGNGFEFLGYRFDRHRRIMPRMWNMTCARRAWTR